MQLLMFIPLVIYLYWFSDAYKHLVDFIIDLDFGIYQNYYDPFCNSLRINDVI